MSPLRVLLLACACLSLAPSAPAVNRQFNGFTAASNQPLAVNPAVETLEDCATCVPPTKAESILARDCPTCPVKRATPPALRDDCVECLTGEDTATATAPFTTVVETCADCEPFELHPNVGWSVDTDRSGTGVNLGAPRLPHPLLVLRARHVVQQITILWPSARILLAGEHFHLVKIWGRPVGGWELVNPERDTSLLFTETDTSHWLQCFLLRVANACETESP